MIEYCMKVAVCDDTPEDLRQVMDMLRRIAAQEEVDCRISGYTSGIELLRAIESGEEYHALVLDVMMDGMNGMELAATLRKQKNQTNIVFVSFNRDMALQGYEVAAARYLMKPLNEEKLREALLFCYKAGMGNQKIVLPTAKGRMQFALEELIYAETWGRGLRVTTTHGQEEVNLKISDLEVMLPQTRFVLCHRTIIVNLEYVRYLRYCELELKTGDVLPVSKYRQNATREKLFGYLEG